MTNYSQHQAAVGDVVHLIQPIRVSVINRVLAVVTAAQIMSQSAHVSLLVYWFIGLFTFTNF